MKIETTGQATYLTLIANRSHKDAILRELSDLGAHVMTTAYGKGTVKASYLMDMFGLVPEENKAVISCIMRKELADKAMQIFIEKYDFGKPNTGIAFATNLNKLSI
ncbi:hypothetical protein LJC61_07340 [Ruminococcaceae bacterium OttesenSCG-928-A16]|nr:hypothetical protein [Ruminococcaceae bacterium OttesenSCG-928-A16]